MATWHQSKSNASMIHPTLWSVVTDPLGGFRSAMLFETERSANDWLASKAPASSYVLAPALDVTRLSIRAPSSWSKTKRAEAMATVRALQGSWDAFKQLNPEHAKRAFVTVYSRSNRVTAKLQFGSDQGTSTVAVQFEAEA